MRHGKAGRKFGRKSAPRQAMFSNMVTSLIEHERIRTTDAKAKELRKIAERTITWAASVGNLVESKKQDAADKARVVHAMRMASRVVRQKDALHKLFHDVGPRLAARPGGYTRIMKIGNSHGDAAPMSIIELVDRAGAEPEKDAAPAEAKPAAKNAKAAKADAPAAEKPAKKKAKKSTEE